jgi:hypothetical protein
MVVVNFIVTWRCLFSCDRGSASFDRLFGKGLNGEGDIVSIVVIGITHEKVVFRSSLS